ncbi:MAG: dicarboxylate/amino acid:cation symporter [Gammaproteobacteria bacterium]|nr:dicarboxylate/amino acid:cation symporter [Gammaproteobacteria bacterium]
MFGVRFNWQVLLAASLGVAFGLWSRGADPASGLLWVDFFGALLIGALKMLAVPLVCASIIIAMAGFSSPGKLGQLGGRTVLLYLSTTAIAALLGVTAVVIAKPGLVDGDPAYLRVPLSALTADLPEEVADSSVADMLDSLLSLVPANVIGAAAADDMIGLTFFSILFGFFLARTDSEAARVLRLFWQGVLQIMLKMTGWVMAFAPIGIFGLVASAVARTDWGVSGPALGFAGLVVAALLIHAAILLPVVLAFAGRGSPGTVYRAVMPAVVTGFATASSATTLPVAMKCMEERLGVPSRITSLVLPAGSSLSLNGTALYQAMAAVFLAQVYGVDLGIAASLGVLALAVVTSASLPGVPSASLVSLTIILSALELPPEALGVVLVFDRLLDMARTAVNVLGNAVCAVVVARLDGDEGVTSEAKPTA